MKRKPPRRRLPIGIQTFRKIREEGCYYVDKTVHIERLIDAGSRYFLSRPRRFGKSLLVDTIKELFEGNEALFRGLHIHDRWDWSVRNPVVRLSFGGSRFRTEDDLSAHVLEQLGVIAGQAGIVLHGYSETARFRQLVRELHERTGHDVVVLVDEYDKPILDPLMGAEGKSDLARRNRDFLRALYGNAKELDAHIRFVFLTGVSKFSKVSLFSDLNNLEDITIDPRFATICGYAERDLDEVFAPELDGLDRDEIRDWYNGYSWLGDEKLYNPFDVLLLFSSRSFRAHWFETGSPAFLIDALRERRVRPLDLESMVASDKILSAFDVEHMSTEALLFQTGYLTIAEAQDRGGRVSYRLGYPNREVREALNECLLLAIGWEATRETASRDRLYDLLCAADFSGLETLFRSLFASIPYNWHVRNDLARWEGYYASVLYAFFASLGVDLTVEDASSAGRLDMAVRVGGRVFLFEYKVVEQAGRGSALAQLKERGYAEKYRALGQPIHLVGIEFSSKQRNLVGFEVEMVG